ncbi:uncharacterized protein LOC116299648 [Actinia tenebrosa]|uniref:Uncharacterized protein LOC116299648 n=1 Tax=Actinia tenebrosa TaxID=6105 RepID=A0A6P8IDF1_ACTTE|nr:uncharacterized protein LOC116299648 [Actinia tenebrosa]XP_031564207.1 uncharacterized protein LOC116299648 [Actinia tenebrosa]XP_031564208.1 uncharacterized protein LOC116299648 [Actinia tenebrosa]
MDRCIVHRDNNVKDNGVKVTEDVRDCVPAAKCVLSWLYCEALKKHSGSKDRCDSRCCKGNLCNKGKIEPPKYEFFKPSGKNLTCYTCSDFPAGTRLADSPEKTVPRSCTSPIKQICGRFPKMTHVMQDRCITLKVKAVVENKEFDWTYRGCSSIYHCSFTEALWRHELNKTSEEDGTGITYLSGKSSCCHGNLCNSTTDNIRVHSAAITNVEHLSTGLACFLCFVSMAMIKAHIG